MNSLTLKIMEAKIIKKKKTKLKKFMTLMKSKMKMNSYLDKEIVI